MLIRVFELGRLPLSVLVPRQPSDLADRAERETNGYGNLLEIPNVL